MRKYVHISDSETQELFKMSSYAFGMNLKESSEPEPPYGLWRGVDVDGKLVSGAGLYPLTVLLKGAEIGMGGIGGVATWPQYRRQGHIAWLMKEMLQEMRERNLHLSGLWPFNWDFYRKFGWELITTVMGAEIKIDDLDALPKPQSGQGELLRDEAELLAVSAEMAQDFQLMCLRNDRWLKLALKPWGKPAITWVWRDNNKVEGYFLCTKDNNTIIIHDIFWSNTNALWGMLDLITRHQAQVEKARLLHLPVNNHLPVLLANQYQEFKLKPLTMGRIVDVESLFSSLNWPKVDGKLTIQVSDRHGSWNDDVFTLTFEAGKCSITRGGTRPDLELGIQQLTQLAVGFADVRTLALGNKLIIHDKHQLAESIFPQDTPFFTERF